MSAHAEAVRRGLSQGPASARQLADYLAASQPTVSRALAELGDEIVRLGAARSIQYTLRDRARGLPDIPIHQVDTEGKVRKLGVLIPVRPEGFVMHGEDGISRHSEGIPWWLLDLRPQGYLGRAYATRHGPALGLPARLTDWTDTHALRALLAHGHDLVGNLLPGDLARERFLATPLPTPIRAQDKAVAYVRLAGDAARGEIPGSSAGGEQPKFAAFAETPDGPRHVLVKFTERETGPVSERWRDLLLVEHIALGTLRSAGVPAARTHILDHQDQRFLEVERFDRIGPLGRRAVISLATLDAEFVGAGAGGWPRIARRLAAERHIESAAVSAAALLWAFGTLIGNTDMHAGNLSFLAEHGRPCRLAPAYDMTSMAFAPRSGGGLPDGLPEAGIHASVANDAWRQAETLARAFLGQIELDARFSRRFAPCIAALDRHIAAAGEKIARLG